MPRKTYTDLKVENEALRQLAKELIKDYGELWSRLHRINFKNANVHNLLIDLEENHEENKKAMDSHKTPRDRQMELVEITGKKLNE